VEQTQEKKSKNKKISIDFFVAAARKTMSVQYTWISSIYKKNKKETNPKMSHELLN
jgi:hypothetical protein